MKPKRLSIIGVGLLGGSKVAERSRHLARVQIEGPNAGGELGYVLFRAEQEEGGEADRHPC